MTFTLSTCEHQTSHQSRIASPWTRRYRAAMPTQEPVNIPAPTPTELAAIQARIQQLRDNPDPAEYDDYEETIAEVTRRAGG
jgi:hypothetical protein